MTFLTSLLLLLVTSRLLGELALKFKQPALLGEIFAGVLLGPALLNWVQPDRSLEAMSDLAVFFIVLSSGLEMNFREVINSMRGRGLVVGLCGFLIPLVSGASVGFAFSMDTMRTLFLGLAVAITALPVAIRILNSFQMLNTELGKFAISTAIFNDLAALLILGVLLNLPSEKTFQSFLEPALLSLGKLSVLVLLVLGASEGIRFFQKTGHKVHLVPEKLISWFGPEALFGLVVIFVLSFGSLSDGLGFHFIVGAFFGALILDKELFLANRFSDLTKTIASVSDGFLAPLFFAFLGLEFDLTAINSIMFTLVVLVVSILSKIIAGYAGGRLIGMKKSESLGLGIILNGRGVMGLVIASIALEKDFIGANLFSTLVLMSIGTTMIAPILFRKLVSSKTFS